MQINHLLKVSILRLYDNLIDRIQLNFDSKVDNLNEKIDYQ